MRRRRDEVTGTRADPAASEALAGGTENQPRSFVRALVGLFRQAVKTLTVRTAPAPKKSRRKRSGEDKAHTAFMRKHMRRLFRKMAWQTGEDWREAQPTFDSDEWHRHQQRTADISADHHHEQGASPNYYVPPSDNASRPLPTPR